MAKDVGIIFLEYYFPSLYVDQAELEDHDIKNNLLASKGKYTDGLGQRKMSFCTDTEDVNSLALTVTHRLIEKTGLSYSEIGCLHAGTESMIDKSKSVKSVLMQLFAEHGNTSIEGIGSINACYGGTESLFNVIHWLESSYWDGRYGLVVAADIAVYATGIARCTGGAGAVAMLIGPNAPLIFDSGCRSTYMNHAYDFYKPDMMSEYPMVDGQYSIRCYLNALDSCYSQFCLKAKKFTKAKSNTEHSSDESIFSLNSADAFLFHSPFCKMVHKSFARLWLIDLQNSANPHINGISNELLTKLRNVPLSNETLPPRETEQASLAASQKLFASKTKPSLLLATETGNSYTASLYGSLVSHLISQDIDKLRGQRLVLFSYGSGYAAAMFSLHIPLRITAQCQAADNKQMGDTGEDCLGSLEKLIEGLKDIRFRLDSRFKVDPSDFDQMMRHREEIYNTAPLSPKACIDHMFSGTYYLTQIDSKYRRFYSRKPLESRATYTNLFISDHNTTVTRNGFGNQDLSIDQQPSPCNLT